MAVCRRFVAPNPNAVVELPALIDGLFRPHDMGQVEQEQIARPAPECLRNVIRIVTETSLRIYKQLAPYRRLLELPT